MPSRNRPSRRELTEKGRLYYPDPPRRIAPPGPPHWHQDGPAGWGGETIELSGHGSRNGARALFFTCSEATVHECADTKIYQQPGPFSCHVLQATAPPVALNDPWPENTESPRPPSGSSSSGRTGLTCLKSESPPGVDRAAPWKTNRLWVGDELPDICLLNRDTAPTRLSTANDSQAGPGRYAASRVEGG